MSAWTICIFLLGGALGLFVGVRALLLALAAWALTLAVVAALGRLDNFWLWLAAGALLQCGYFAGLALRALAQEPRRDVRRPFAAREKRARPRRGADREGA